MPEKVLVIWLLKYSLNTLKMCPTKHMFIVLRFCYYFFFKKLRKLEMIGGRRVNSDAEEDAAHIYYPEWICNIWKEERIHKISY